MYLFHYFTLRLQCQYSTIGCKFVGNHFIPLTILRARLHLKLARCEDQSDFVAQTAEESNKAVEVDHGVVGSGFEMDRVGMKRYQTLKGRF